MSQQDYEDAYQAWQNIREGPFELANPACFRLWIEEQQLRKNYRDSPWKCDHPFRMHEPEGGYNSCGVCGDIYPHTQRDSIIHDPIAKEFLRPEKNQNSDKNDLENRLE